MYAIVKKAMFGKDVIAVFTTQEKAEEYINRSSVSTDKIEFQHVNGNYKSPDTVYAAHTYLKEHDIFYFIGLYADYDSAEHAAGDPNSILGLKPDSR